MIINYTVNAGYLPKDHWVYSVEGGGRNRGEACHIYDLFTFLTQARVLRIQAYAMHPQRDYYSTRGQFCCRVHFAVDPWLP